MYRYIATLDSVTYKKYVIAYSIKNVFLLRYTIDRPKIFIRIIRILDGIKEQYSSLFYLAKKIVSASRVV